MPKLIETDDWVSALRTFIRDTLGNKNWQIRKGERDKVRLVVRFDDGTRKTWYLPYLWQRTNAKQIQHFIEAVSYLHLSKRVPIDEAVERTKAQAPKAALPKNKVNPQVILDAWKQFGDFKINQVGDISQQTWDKGYSKTYRKLKEVVYSPDAINLLKNIGKFNEAGSRTREENVQRAASFFKVGCI